MKRLLLSLSVLSLAACNGSLEPAVQEPAVSCTHEIPVDSALFSLESYLSSHTRAAGNSIEDIFAIVTDSIVSATRSGVAPQNGRLLYIANLTRGHAVLAADDRIPARIIAIADSGHVSASDFYMSLRSQNDTVSTPKSIQNRLICQYAVSSVRSDAAAGLESASVQIQECTDNLLDRYRYWTQRSPFNDLCPKVQEYILYGRTVKTAAGCFPLSVAKLFAYFRHPQTFTFEGDTVNWDALNRSLNSDEGRKSAAVLLRGIGYHCLSIYMSQGTFTFPLAAAMLMRRYYSNVQLNGYSTQRVRAMLDDGCPAIVYACPAENGIIDITGSHAWLIDGYRILSENVSNTMMHCDFGWGSSCNGYFTSGIFDMSSPDTEFDNPDDRGIRTADYGFIVGTITYSSPQQE